MCLLMLTKVYICNNLKITSDTAIAVRPIGPAYPFPQDRLDKGKIDLLKIITNENKKCESRTEIWIHTFFSYY